MNASIMTPEPTSRFMSSSDGLKLHARDYGRARSDRLPVVCLAGLSRNSADFDSLARSLSTDRRVLAIDYRGRGRSDWDPKWQNYSPGVEMGDVVAMLTAFGIGHAVFVGTSRGGLITMLLTAARPGLIAGAVLNDVGPEIDPRGLARIKSYLGKFPTPASLAEGASFLKSLGSSRFTNLTDADWLAQAGAVWQTRDGKLVPAFDPNLTKPLEALSFDEKLPTLWPQFLGLADVPVLVVRGENSDLLSAETVTAMTARHPNCQAFTVPGQGHAPLLADQPTIGRISAFCRICDTRAHRVPTRAAAHTA